MKKGTTVDAKTSQQIEAEFDELERLTQVAYERQVAERQAAHLRDVEGLTRRWEVEFARLALERAAALRKVRIDDGTV